jgi:uncharacterized protein DUF3108
MKMPRRISRLAVMFLAGMILFLPTIATEVPAQEPAADVPSRQIGDEWKYTSGLVRKVIAVDGDAHVTTATGTARSNPDYRYHLDKNLTLTSVVNKAGESVYDPGVGLKLLDFPLKVGKSWTSNQQLRSRTGSYLPYDNTFTVTKYEEVKTKAGTFKAFRIRWYQENKATYQSFRGTFDVWYSPEVKAIVKGELQNATGQWLPDYELESYSLK